jgi:hypothetical protein
VGVAAPGFISVRMASYLAACDALTSLQRHDDDTGREAVAGAVAAFAATPAPAPPLMACRLVLKGHGRPYREPSLADPVLTWNLTVRRAVGGVR